MAGFELYPDADGEWRWRCVADNGRIVATGGEGYHNRADAEHGAMVALEILAGYSGSHADDTPPPDLVIPAGTTVNGKPTVSDTAVWLEPNLDPGEAERLRNMFPPS